MELSGIRYLPDLALDGASVFVRVDFNVPLKDGVVTDDQRIVAALPTIRRLREAGARIVLASHLGRPDGQRVEKLSMIPVGQRLAELLHDEVIVADDCVGDEVARAVRDLPPGGILLLENLRFHAAEEAADPVFASELARLADIYVNDAFGTAHRAHASTYAMVRHFDDTRRAAGILVEKELRFLTPLLRDAERPYVGILGGSKVSDKIKVIDNLIGKLDYLLIGGAMAYTFLAARGVAVGGSRVESARIDTARDLLRSAENRRTRVVLPIDHIVAEGPDAAPSTTEGEAIADGLAGFDIGPKTLDLYRGLIASAKTVFWNGPVGMFENPKFSAGTFGVAAAMADAKAVTVVGGGDSAAAAAEAGFAERMSHVSTGGGASLEYIEGRDLPGIAALRAGHRFD